MERQIKIVYHQIATLVLFQTTIIQKSFNFRSSTPEVFLGKVILKIYSKFTREDRCRSVISIKCSTKCSLGLAPYHTHTTNEKK